MNSHFIKTAWRNLTKNLTYSFINIGGLALGLAAAILLSLYINMEMSFDNYHENADRLMVLCADVKIGDFESRTSSSSGITGEKMVELLPEVEASARFKRKNQSMLKYRDKHFTENRVYYADSNAFDLFSWNVLSGDKNTFLKEPNSIVLSKSLAVKIFGDADPLGKSIILDDNRNFKVTGVFSDIPINSTLRMNALVSMSTLVNELGADHPHFNDPTSYNFRTYLLLQPGVDSEALNEKIRPLLGIKAKERLAEMNSTQYLFLHPLSKFYLYSISGEGGPIIYVYIFSVVALFILLIACVNFMNLSTARYSSRAQEVGMKKVCGASRKQLIIQFLGESVIMSFIAAAIALIITLLALPELRALTGREIYLGSGQNMWVMPGVMLLTLVTGLTAGSYPALFLSRFKPVNVLKGKQGAAKSVPGFRKVLVVCQFVVSVTLIIFMGVVLTQLSFLKNRDNGFEKENLLVVGLTPEQAVKHELIKTGYLNNPVVLSASTASAIPGTGFPMNAKWPEGFKKNEMIIMQDINVDEKYAETFGLEFVAGRSFSGKIETDTRNACVINETAARRIGWEDPVGKVIRALDVYSPDLNKAGYIDKKVIGVVKDFSLGGVMSEPQPLFMDFDPDNPMSFMKYRLLTLKLKPGGDESILASLRSTWAEVFPGEDFDYIFFEEFFGRQFIGIERSRSIFFYFTILAVVISCLGLFGMASFDSERRTKEIGIRKVLGGTTGDIITLMNKSFFKWLLLANALAYPLAYYFSSEWLGGFAVRAELTVLHFLLATCLVLLTGFLTTLYHTLKSARSNPVNSLKYE